ncbi:MAG: anti-sigma factor antagonist [Anaerolineales bacterium]|nr:anti-sigma factor antagonist [Anaerolineales bacterium]
MDIQVDRRSNRVVVYCAGYLDAASAPELEKVVKPLVEPLAKEERLPVTLDLSGVTYMSSAGVRTLLFLFKMAKQRPIERAPESVPLLRLANISPPVQRVLDMTNLLEELARWEAVPAETAPPAAPGHTYRDLLARVRGVFPAPISDPVRDAYFVQSVARGLNRIDDLKTERPYLGERVKLDYDAARATTLPDQMSTLEETIADLADYMQGVFIWGHPHTQENVIPPTTIPSIIGQLFGSIYNPNVIWDEYSHRVSQAEVEVASMCASLVGYDPAKAVGVFTFGGTGTILYGVKLGVEKALPGAFRDGVRQELKVVSSDAGHYSKLSVLGWLGLGTNNLVTVPTDDDNSMGLAELESILRGLLERAEKIACIVATMGTTDAFGIDNLEYIVRLRDRLADEYELPYRPHVHADAVIGWAWAVFNDYDFDANPMGFPSRTLRSLWDARTNIRALGMADSIGVDFHKTGYTPYVSSLFLCKDRSDLNLITRDTALMPYLFQFGNYHPGVFTLETSRSGGAILSALANLKLLGQEGYRALLGHIVSMAEVLRAKLEEAPHACLVNDYNYGPVTLFRVYPDGVEAKAAYREESTRPELADQLRAHNDYNRRVFDVLHRQMESGEGMALSLTDQYRVTPYGEPILALKSFVMSPFVDEAAMNHLITCIEQARKDERRKI